jgi:GAF domain-containing protein
MAAQQDAFGPAQAFAHLARELAEQPDAAAAANRMVDMASKVLGCAGASLLRLTDKSKLQLVAGSDLDLLTIAAATANAHDSGVAKQVLQDRVVVLSNDLRADPRWPAYTRELTARTSIRSALGFYLHLDNVGLGALTLYSDRVDFFTPELHTAAGIYADHAAIALARAMNHDEAANLHIALSSSREIGIALGILMTTHHVSEKDAFAMLRVASQHAHRKLRDIAADVAMTGQITD